MAAGLLAAGLPSGTSKAAALSSRTALHHSPNPTILCSASCCYPLCVVVRAGHQRAFVSKPWTRPLIGRFHHRVQEIVGTLTSRRHRVALRMASF
jgi:hypothetical protein